MPELLPHELPPSPIGATHTVILFNEQGTALTGIRPCPSLDSARALAEHLLSHFAFEAGFTKRADYGEGYTARITDAGTKAIVEGWVLTQGKILPEPGLAPARYEITDEGREALGEVPA